MNEARSKVGAINLISVKRRECPFFVCPLIRLISTGNGRGVTACLWKKLVDSRRWRRVSIYQFWIVIVMLASARKLFCNRYNSLTTAQICRPGMTVAVSDTVDVANEVAVVDSDGGLGSPVDNTEPLAVGILPVSMSLPCASSDCRC